VALLAWFRDNRSLLLITALTAVFTPVMVDIWPEPKINLGIKLFLVASYLILAVATALTEVSRQRTEEKLREQRVDTERELKADLHGLLVRGGLLHGVSHEISEVLSEVRREIVQAVADGTPDRFLIARERAIKAALRSLCEVLRSDRTRSRDERLAATYFKATLFEWDGTTGREGVLRRAYWHYPITRQPQTHYFDVYHDANRRRAVLFEKHDDSDAAGR
jgi:hypothetical protein